MSTGFSGVFGAFRVLRRRSRELSQPGLTIWADAGERAAKAVQTAVRDGAHVVEVKALSLEEEIKAMLADGSIDAGEMNRLRLVPAKVHGLAERAHDLGEAVS